MPKNQVKRKKYTGPGNSDTVVVGDSAINSYDGYKVEVKILEKKPMTYREACEEIRKLRGTGIWEGNLDEMRECRG